MITHFFMIEELAGHPVGSISANSVNRTDGTFKYGIGIIAAKRQKGYASEALKIFLNYYFNELRLHKVHAEVYAFHKASQLLHEQLGFTLEGRLRKAKFTQGSFHDILIFGKLKEEFNLIHQKNPRSKELDQGIKPT